MESDAAGPRLSPIPARRSGGRWPEVAQLPAGEGLLHLVREPVAPKKGAISPLCCATGVLRGILFLGRWVFTAEGLLRTEYRIIRPVEISTSTQEFLPANCSGPVIKGVVMRIDGTYL